MIVKLDHTFTMIKMNLPMWGKGTPVPPSAILQKDAILLMQYSSQKSLTWENVRQKQIEGHAMKYLS